VTKLTADTPEFAEVVTNLVTLSVMITATVGIVIKMIKCPKCKTEYSDRISNNCFHCGTELPEEKESVTPIDSSIFEQLHNEIKNSFLTKERMKSRKKIMTRKFKAGDFDK